MPKPLPITLLIVPPHDGCGWQVRVDATAIPGRGYGVAEDANLGFSFEQAMLVALANGNGQEENQLS